VASELARPGSRLREGACIPCTVLFVDMRGSTGLSERMRPEEVADFLTRFRRRIANAVEAHEGLIEKFTGDGALIVFGVPEPRPDDARRGLACALDLVAAIDEWNHNRDPDSPLSIVVGLHSGPCFCGVVGEAAREEFTVIGDPVNVAARLESLAKEHDEAVIASAAVLAEAGVATTDPCWRSLGDTLIRGRRDPVAVFAYDLSTAASAARSRHDGEAPARAYAASLDRDRSKASTSLAGTGRPIK
jgi:adenylate cyclase